MTISKVYVQNNTSDQLTIKMTRKDYIAWWIESDEKSFVVDANDNNHVEDLGWPVPWYDKDCPDKRIKISVSDATGRSHAEFVIVDFYYNETHFWYVTGDNEDNWKISPKERYTRFARITKDSENLWALPENVYTWGSFQIKLGE